MALSSNVFEIKRDIDLKSHFFHTTPAFDAAVTADPSEFF